MVYRVLADITFVLHLAFIVWVVLGWLCVRWWRWVMWLHLPAAAWGALIEFFGWPCPLTPLENYFRRLGGQAGYEGGFIEHYIRPILYPGELDYTLQLSLGVAVILINAAGYWWALHRSRSVQREGERAPSVGK